jgi:hypothetical protein
MIIVLDDYFTAESDQHSWTLKYKKPAGINAKTGKPQFSQRNYYYPTLKMLLIDYVDNKIQEHSDKHKSNITDLLQVLLRIEEHINSLNLPSR